MLVSVIISTYNSRPYLEVALEALAAQTLPRDAYEVIVVDDGSTDGTWDYLGRVAAERPEVSIVSQPHSGGASRGRNRGLELARGRYVFFHDADDYLGSDALRRLSDVAEAEGSDLVLGHVRRFGRDTGHRPSDLTVLDADLVADGTWRSLSPHKLIRRSLIEGLGVRFPEDQVFGEDQVFVATCLLAASKVSMLGGYDFYHRRARPDFGNLTTARHQTLTNKQLTTCRMTALVVAHTEPGRRRDALLRRVVYSTLNGALQHIFVAASAPERAAFLTRTRAEVFPYVSQRLLRLADGPTRWRLLAARDGTADDVLELFAVLARPWSYRVQEGRLCFDLGPGLNAAVPPAARTVPEVAPLEHEVFDVEPTRSGLALRLRIGAGPVPYDQIVLQGRTRTGAWTRLAGSGGPAPSATPGTGAPIDLTVAVPLASEAAAPDDEHRWALRLVGYADGVVVARSPLSWPEGRFPLASRRSTVRIRWSRRELKLYGGTDGQARLHLR